MCDILGCDKDEGYLWFLCEFHHKKVLNYITSDGMSIKKGGNK